MFLLCVTWNGVGNGGGGFGGDGRGIGDGGAGVVIGGVVGVGTDLSRQRQVRRNYAATSLLAVVPAEISAQPLRRTRPFISRRAREVDAARRLGVAP